MEIEKPFETLLNSQTLIQGNFMLNKLPTKLTVLSNVISFVNQRVQCTYSLCFDFSYDIFSQSGLNILCIYSPEPLYFSTSDSIENWDSILLRIIKRKRFHDFFKGIKKIGKGNFASVYLSQRLHDNKLFAVKAFQKESTFKAKNGKQGLQNQVNILKKFNNPNIVRLEGVFETDNSLYLIMEYVQGRNLGQIMEQNKQLSILDRKKLIKGILSGLAELEAQSIAHRDIKPQNIMVTSNGQPIIVDFGLATDTHQDKFLFVRCGTPGFVAPEILNIKDMDTPIMTPMCDVFSVGAILYEMIFRKPLFEGDTNGQVLERNRKCQFAIPNISEFATCDQLFLLKRMLEIYPQTRISASQALKSGYFAQQRQGLGDITMSQGYGSLPPIKYSSAMRARRIRKNQNQN